MSMIACLRSADATALATFRHDESALEAFVSADGILMDDSYCEPDKAWHAIHWMLTGEVEGGDRPLSMALLGGEEIGDDVGYGPARILTPAQVQSVAAALAPIDEATFRKRYEPKRMDQLGIYPQIWSRDGDEGLDYVMEHFFDLTEFYRTAAGKGHGVVLWMS